MLCGLRYRHASGSAKDSDSFELHVPSLSIRRGDRTVLAPNMTLHFMPALWLDDGGLELSETILITPKGAECLCKTP